MRRKPLPNALDIDLRGGLTERVTPHAGRGPARRLPASGRRARGGRSPPPREALPQGPRSGPDDRGLRAPVRPRRASASTTSTTSVVTWASRPSPATRCPPPRPPVSGSTASTSRPSSPTVPPRAPSCPRVGRPGGPARAVLATAVRAFVATVPVERRGDPRRRRPPRGVLEGDGAADLRGLPRLPARPRVVGRDGARARRPVPRRQRARRGRPRRARRRGLRGPALPSAPGGSACAPTRPPIRGTCSTTGRGAAGASPSPPT